jgi:hypothetical protein
MILELLNLTERAGIKVVVLLPSRRFPHEPGRLDATPANAARPPDVQSRNLGASSLTALGPHAAPTGFGAARDQQSPTRWHGTLELLNLGNAHRFSVGLAGYESETALKGP